MDYLKIFIKAINLNENLITEEEMIFMIGSQQCNITSINYNVVPTEIICIVPPNPEGYFFKFVIVILLKVYLYCLIVV